MGTNHKKAQQKHDNLCDVVENRLAEMRLKTYRSKLYKNRKAEGEIDVLGFNERYLVLCEIKSSDAKLEKGIEQLYRAEEHYTPDSNNRRVFKMLVYNTHGNRPISEWIK